MKQYQSVVLNGYTTKFFLDKALNELAEEGFTIHSTIMGNIIILEKEVKEIPTTEIISPDISGGY